MTILFIDPGSTVSGWALFNGDGQYVESGVIRGKGETAFERLSSLSSQYQTLAARLQPGEVIFERMNGIVSYKCLWSVGVIGVAIKKGSPSTHVHDHKDFQISPGSWKKYSHYNGDRKPLAPYEDKVGSLDELVAIAMGIYWFTEDKEK